VYKKKRHDIVLFIVLNFLDGLTIAKYIKDKLQRRNFAKTFRLEKKNNCKVFNCHSQAREVVKFGVAHSQRRKRFILLLKERATYNNSSFSFLSQGVCRLKAKSSLRLNKMFCFACKSFSDKQSRRRFKAMAKIAFFANSH
jgi:hypothetical protein